ncbi:MAG: right-handed parallel beta-helix repeat-containing protein [Candidatus Thermoplasmatota archaeon]|nr:right-handed parallel beta-helix repeat-containing protein [Candidatus Thermoplasmatota archaeon]
MPKLSHLTIFLVVLAMISEVSSGDEDERSPFKQHAAIFFDGAVHTMDPPDGMIGSGTREDPYLVSGFWFNTTSSPGVTIINSTSHILVDLNIFTSRTRLVHPGLLIVNSSNVTVRNVAAYYCSRGIEIRNCTDIRISDSGFYGSNDGIYVEGRDIEIEKVDCKVNIYSGILLNRSSNIFLRNVTTSSNTAILGVTSGIRIVDSSDIDIKNSISSLNYGFGILAESTDPSSVLEGIRISSSLIDTNNNGIVMSRAVNCTIEEDTIQYNTNGIYISYSRDIEVKGCGFNKNTYGAFFSVSSDLDISNSEFDRNENSIYLDSTEGSNIHENVFTNGTYHAIVIDTWTGSGPLSSYNRIFWNNFRDNGQGGCQVIDNGDNNRWNEGSIGNLWSDHCGPDLDNDSIVDEPYIIKGTANATDRFPIASRREGAVDENEVPGKNVVITDTNDLNFWLLVALSGVMTLLLLAGALLFSAGRTGKVDHDL